MLKDHTDNLTSNIEGGGNLMFKSIWNSKALRNIINAHYSINVHSV